MADIKISAMPAATLPLTGAEVVPVLQGGANDKTTSQAIANLGANPPVVYTANPNTEALTPLRINSPAIAYSADGSGSIYGWNTTLHTWQ